jgi:hypothetical protein
VWIGSQCMPNGTRRIRHGVRPVANAWCAQASSHVAVRRRQRCLGSELHEAGCIAGAVGEGCGVPGASLGVSGAGQQDQRGASRARSPRPPAPQTGAHAGATGWIPWG